MEQIREQLGNTGRSTERKRILMVCTGNICRSPTAHGVLEKMVADAGLAGRIEVDSAGTHGYHVGDAPDRRSQAHAARPDAAEEPQHAVLACKKILHTFGIKPRAWRAALPALLDRFYRHG